MKTEEKERRKNKEDRKRHVEQVTNARRHAALRRLPSSGPYYATLLRGLLSVPWAGVGFECGAVPAQVALVLHVDLSKFYI